MIIFSKIKQQWQDSESALHLCTDLPYRYGFSNIKTAFNSAITVTSVFDRTIQITTQDIPSKRSKYKSLAYRVILLTVGILECIPLIGIIVTIADRYFRKPCLRKNRLRQPDQLMSSSYQIRPYQYYWHLNLALLRSAYNNCGDDKKKLIRFLAANFLDKVTPKSLARFNYELGKIDPSYKPSQQGSPFEEYNYYRENVPDGHIFGQKFNKQLAYGTETLLILTDTIELDPILFPWFEVITEQESKETYAKMMYKSLLDYATGTDHPSWKNSLKKPFIVDVSTILKNSIVTDQDTSAEKIFRTEFETFAHGFKEAQELAIKMLLANKPDLIKSKEAILSFLQKNTACIHRVQTTEFSGIKLLPIGVYTNEQEQLKSPLVSMVKQDGNHLGFISATGLSMNAVSFRRLVVDDLFMTYPDIKYKPDALLSKNQYTTLYYPTKESFTNSRCFQRLLYLFGSKQDILAADPVQCGTSIPQLKERSQQIQQRPHMKVMGKLTMDLLQGLMNEIPSSTWENIHKDPILLQVFQTSLFLIQQHLATAELSASANQFNNFMESIEVIHAELATLLELSTPFNKGNFVEIYHKELLGKSVPDALETNLRCGLAKSATNAFAGAAAAAATTGPLEIVVGDQSYYEHVSLAHHTFDEFMKNPALPKTNLYHAQFYPNINVGSNPIQYKKKNIIADVQRLLAEDRVSSHFTVAVDITIDHFHSEAVHTLLTTFEKEIKEGKINFVFSTSGQKFYNVGMDHYYAAPFYVVNNGDDKWNSFNTTLLSHPLYAADSLSTQWFSLVTKYAPDGLHNYRKLIFDNTKFILQRVPESLKIHDNYPGKIGVNTIHEEMLPAFIDIKVFSPKKDQEKDAQAVRQKFYTMMLQEKLEAGSRGSFGFFHCNFGSFGELDDKARTIRINPGINPDDNAKLIKFLRTYLNKIFTQSRIIAA